MILKYLCQQYFHKHRKAIYLPFMQAGPTNVQMQCNNSAREASRKLILSEQQKL